MKQELLYPQELQPEMDKVVLRWLNLHQRLVGMLVLGSILVELAMLIALNHIDGFVSISLTSYTMKYFLAPAMLDLLLAGLCWLINRRGRLSLRGRCYATSLSMTAVCFVLYNAHSVFPVLRMLFLLCILLTATYGDLTLTSLVALANLAALAVSDLFLVWDPSRPQVLHSVQTGFDFLLGLVLLIGGYLCCRAIIYYEREKNLAAARKEMEQRALRQELSRDALTQLGNRKALREALDRMTEAGKPQVFAMIDLDRFKQLNDTYGHLEGDRCLQTFASLLAREFAGHQVFRYGGDEFCVLFDLPELAPAIALCRQLTAQLEAPDNGLAARIRCSFGLARFTPGMSAHTLLQQADEALYRSKGQEEHLCAYNSAAV